jgi:UPF0755 protein
VEKEGKLPEERPVIAAVFLNRLRMGIKLDCDPTVIYAALLQNRYRGTIYRSDLDNPHPYNTYRNPGLPPGPIANPGLTSLQAVWASRVRRPLRGAADGSAATVSTATSRGTMPRSPVPPWR